MYTGKPWILNPKFFQRQRELFQFEVRIRHRAYDSYRNLYENELYDSLDAPERILTGSCSGIGTMTRVNSIARG